MSTPDHDWQSVELLAEPTRRQVYDAVRAQDEPMTREAVAGAVGISQRLAAFHLDRLADAGLLLVDFARPAGRRGPGAGRPAKRYRAAAVQVQVAIPPRRYNVVARILAKAVEQDPADARAAAAEAAYDEGRAAAREVPGTRGRGTRVGRIGDVLSVLGFEPQEQQEQHRLRLRNCPFHEAVDVAPQLVCGLNQRLVSGVIDGLGLAETCAAQPDGVPPDCCVSVHLG
jgi:predicted ArsR family transcriptional regulator